LSIGHHYLAEQLGEDIRWALQNYPKLERLNASAGIFVNSNDFQHNSLKQLALHKVVFEEVGCIPDRLEGPMPLLHLLGSFPNINGLTFLAYTPACHPNAALDKALLRLAKRVKELCFEKLQCNTRILEVVYSLGLFSHVTRVIFGRRKR
jgi:hypothetical protein